MAEKKLHSYLPRLHEQFADGRIARREFLRTSTLLGLSAAAAYGFVGKVTGQHWFVSPTRAAMPMGGTLRYGQRLEDIKNPHVSGWWGHLVARQVCEHLTNIGTDGLTHPLLLESWSASDDLRSWTLNLRKGVKWHSGRPFLADDVIWNLKHVLDEKTGSAVLGLMESYMLETYDTGKMDESGQPVMGTRLWDANAIERVDDHTVRLNLKAPQLAVPENLFHQSLVMLDPEENGEFGVGSNGTGAFVLTEYETAKSALLDAYKDYWGEGPYIDHLRYIDLGENPAAGLAALASKQVDGIWEVDLAHLAAIEEMDHVRLYTRTTAHTGVARMKVTEPPFTDPRVRKAMRLAVDPRSILKVGYQGHGAPAEHHHVSPIHPEYAKLPFMERDVEAAKKLLAEAGHPDGIDVTISVKTSPSWELDTVLGMVEQWQEANIRVKVDTMPANLYWDIWTKTPFGFTEWSHRPLGITVLALAYRSGVPWNESSYSNPEFDRLLLEAEGIVDPKERREVMAKLETIMQEDGPIVQPLWRAIFTVFDKRIKGFEMDPNNYTLFKTLAIEA